MPYKPARNHYKKKARKTSSSPGKNIEGLVKLCGVFVLGIGVLSNISGEQIQAIFSMGKNSSSDNSRSNCNIKGNISISSGKKLYHLPGMEDYIQTNIEPVHGERWFCSETEAINAGWVKAPR